VYIFILRLSIAGTPPVDVQNGNFPSLGFVL
jgi:hypothetical protein